MKSGIYKWTNPKGHVYIGQAEDLIRREKDYYHPNRIKSQIRIYNSIMFYGIESHIFEIQEYCSIEDLDKRERYWQEFYNVIGPTGLNCILKEVGETRRVVSEDTKKKLSASQMGRPATKGRTGMPHTEETKQKMSLSAMGHKRTVGQKHSQETKDKIKAIRKERNACCKPILQYDLEGNFIKEWRSARDVERELNIGHSNIATCCKGKKKTCGEFKWEYKNKI